MFHIEKYPRNSFTKPKCLKVFDDVSNTGNEVCYFNNFIWNENIADVGEIVISSPVNTQSWLDKLSTEEKERLYNAIGYDVNKNVEHAPSVRNVCCHYIVFF